MIPVRAWGVALCLAAATLLFGFDQSDPDIPKWSAVHLLGAVSFVYLALTVREVPKAWLWALGLFLWAGMSLLWSPDPKGGIVELVNGVSFLGIFLLIATAQRDHLYLVFPVLALAAFAGMIMQLVWPEYYGGFGNENFQTEYYIIVAPFLLVGVWQIKRWVRLSGY